MRKGNIIICLILTLALCLTMGSASAFAATYTMEKAPEVKLGDTVKIELDKVKESQAESKDIYAFKFTPEETGSYMLSFDTTFDAVSKSEEDPAMLMFILTANPESEEADEDGGHSICMSTKGMSEEELDQNDEGMKLMKIMGITLDDPSFTAELNKGKTYYLVSVLNGADSYTSNVTITSHKHDLETVEVPAKYVKEDGFDMFYSGGNYTECKADKCNYYKDNASYDSVSTIELSKEVLSYNGKARKPKVTITDTEDKKLKNGKDYTVEYKNNTEVGKAKVVITFKGHYAGKYTKTFKIVPAKTTMKSVASTKAKTAKVTWKKSKYASAIDGYQIRYSTDKKFNTSKKVTVKSAKKTSTVIKKLKAGKKYYFQVRTYKEVGSKKYYSDWSGWKSVKVKK